MAGEKKVSQLPTTNVIADNDLLLFAKETAPGIYESKGVPASNIALPSDIIPKADKVSGAINNNLAALDANGNLIDSGVNKDFQKGLIIKDISDPTKTNILKSHTATTGTQYEARFPAKDIDVAGLEDIGSIVLTQRFFATLTPLADPVGYFKLATTFSDPDIPQPETSALSTPVTGLNTPQGNWTTESQVVFTEIKETTAFVYLYLAKDSGSANVQSHAHLYRRDALGVETLIAESTKTPNIASTKALYALSFNIPYTGLTAGDRLVLEFYADKVGTGTDPVVRYYVGGTVSPARFELPLSGSNILHDGTANKQLAGTGVTWGHIDSSQIQELGTQSFTEVQITGTETALRNNELTFVDNNDDIEGLIKTANGVAIASSITSGGKDDLYQIGTDKTNRSAYLLSIDNATSEYAGIIASYNNKGEIKSKEGFLVKSQFLAQGIYAIESATYEINKTHGDQPSFTLNQNCTISITDITGDFNVSKVIPIKIVQAGATPALDSSFGTPTANSQAFDTTLNAVNRILLEKYKFDDNTEKIVYTNTVL